MSNENAAVVEQKSDPFQAVAAAMASAAQAVKDGATDARESVAQALPGAGRFVSRTVYTSCYFLSYGVVFPTVLVANLLPVGGPIRYGLADGATAARDAAKQVKQHSAAWGAARRERREARKERSEIVLEGAEAMAVA
jgi:hypothetical protein